MHSFLSYSYCDHYNIYLDFILARLAYRILRIAAVLRAWKTPRMRKGLYLLTLPLFITFQTFAQAPMMNRTLGPIENEVLEYNVYLKTGIFYFSLGEVVFTTTMESGLYKLNVSASTYPRWSRFYEFDSDFSSRLDSTNSYPLEFIRHSLEKGNSVFDSIRFDQKNLSAEEFVSNNDGELFTYDLKLGGRIHDMVSLFYRLRFIDYLSMSVGEQEKLKLLHNRHEYDMSVSYLDHESKKIKKGGKYDAYKIEINAIKGLHFEGNQVMSMWITRDSKRIPVSFETPLKLGSLKIVLKE